MNKSPPNDSFSFLKESKIYKLWEDEVNESAKRTLLRLGRKLRGVEKGTPLSVNGQVNLLMQ